MHRLLLWMATLTALLAAPAFAQAHEEPPARIVAVGDLHGDFSAWEAIAREAGLIDAGGSWAGGETTLVQMGDITDRGPDSLKIIRHLQALQEEAAGAGGKVIVLLGNHEAMNAIGDLRYVHPGEFEAFENRRSESRREAVWKANKEKLIAFYRQADAELTDKEIKTKWIAETPLGMLEHRRAWIPGGELGVWAAGLPAVIQLGKTLFAHGGLSEEFTREPIEAINGRFVYALGADPLTDRTILEDPLGPLWYRGNVMREPVVAPATNPGENEEAGQAEAADEVAVPRPGRSEELDLVLSRYGARRLVVAHTPSIEGIVDDLDGKLLRIDTGISAHYGGPASYLVIEGEEVRAFRREADGSWSAQLFAKSFP
ncbi:metallophosphoesterase [Qipengyuania sp. 1NDH17]|uniref:Metallophosphoesterase n=1 Tax=Qipengyuania polymorpha TaxID=2867234 RepID=A0ABS7J4N4_9SPHN|nr:metallophosphoesterase [Qipengyuania polymorpha]MBX7459024.1 metallophosphoesterase [Qipengyuania polymorpha]